MNQLEELFYDEYSLLNRLGCHASVQMNIKQIAEQIHDELYKTHPGSGAEQRARRVRLRVKLTQEAVDSGKIKPKDKWILDSHLANLSRNMQIYGWMKSL